MNSHFSLVLVTCRSSGNSSSVSGLLPVFPFPENLAVRAGYRRAHPPGGPAVNPVAALWPFPGVPTAVLLLAMQWASRQGPALGGRTSHPITDHTRNHQSCNPCTLGWKSLCHIMGVTFWSCERCIMFMEKGGAITCFKCLHDKLRGLSCPESLRKWAFYAL